MRGARVAVIGGGAAGNAAARTLHTADADLDLELFTRTHEQPTNRTLVNKGVVAGLLEPHQAVLPDTGARLTADTVRALDPRTRQLQLDSGQRRSFDAFIIATGSRPRLLSEEIIGRDEALRSGRLTTLHSMADGAHVRDRLAQTTSARVLILGGGLIASETASLLTDAGHDSVLIARSPMPGASSIGEPAARQLLELHQPQHAAYLGRDVRMIRTHTDHISLTLNDGTQIDGDLAIIAHGTLANAPAPWTGPEGMPVDARLRSLHAPDQRIYAAGGVAIHHYPGHSSYRIDHWDDATAQGTHAAQTVLHDLGFGDDPGPYLPTSTFSVRVHGRTLTGAGHPALGTSTRALSTDPFLIAHHLGDTPVALTGIDAAGPLRQHLPGLHQPAAFPR
ncbi:FAD/NAD(P)-binding oxidoreductase [Auritidibacter ignavus]|uniref:FAD/NAD(P)-binding oxidoreductase n=1 Tax=Auritidibacter ignavus TaxID=678932 RepID=UPI00244806E1|nr:FAD/NAD(P)-binding oxidoreductase [Auritidibacter ignavus]WGH82683.1 FAD/NAD(P)-binding oxidoreductase [Auritidibacter ignavus]